MTWVQRAVAFETLSTRSTLSARSTLRMGEFRRTHERLRQSRLSKAVIAHVKGEVLGQALAVLASVNHLGNVAGTLDQFGDKIRELGDKFDIEGGSGTAGGAGGGRGGYGDDDDGGAGGDGRGEGSALGDLAGGHVNVVTGIAAGGGELAKGLIGGVTGIFSKATSGFKEKGLQGFAQGAAQGVVGRGAFPSFPSLLYGGLAAAYPPFLIR